MLAETLLLTPSPEETAQALELNTEVIKNAAFTPLEKDKAYLQRAQILMLLGQKAEAEQAMQQVSQETSATHGSAVCSANVHRRRQFSQGEGRSKTGRRGKGIGTYLRQPGVLSHGRLFGTACGTGREENSRDEIAGGVEPDLEKLNEWNTTKVDELENAITFYERTVEQFERTHEALAARFGLAEAYRKLGRNEEALESYAAVLGSIRRPSRFRNRWISLKRLREIVLEAWNSWIEQGFYQEAIDLAELMSPAIPRDEAHELVARPINAGPNISKGRSPNSPPINRPTRREELKLRWKRAGAGVLAPCGNPPHIHSVQRCPVDQRRRLHEGSRLYQLGRTANAIHRHPRYHADSDRAGPPRNGANGPRPL